MTYTQDEIETFENRWTDYIDELARLKLAVPADDMDIVSDAQDELRAAVESAVAGFEEDL